MMEKMRMSDYPYAIVPKSQIKIFGNTVSVDKKSAVLSVGDVSSVVENLPNDVLLMGVVDDGLPLLFYLHDPRPGSILVVGDRGTGKTAFLKGLVRTASIRSNQPEIQFVTITNFPDEWANFHVSGLFLGTAPAYAPEISDLLFHLVYRSQKREEQTPILLLFDGLDAIWNMDDVARSNLEYLLLHGPPAFIWPVITINSDYALELLDWLVYFRTYIFGNIADMAVARKLVQTLDVPPDNLSSGFQFYVREKHRWLKFRSVGEWK